jgi:hypothetical protein
MVSPLSSKVLVQKTGLEETDLPPRTAHLASEREVMVSTEK